MTRRIETEVELALLASRIGERLEKLIPSLPGRSTDRTLMAFYMGFRENVRKLEQGILGDFVSVMDRQLDDAWRYGLDKELDSDVQDLIAAAKRKLVAESR